MGKKSVAGLSETLPTTCTLSPISQQSTFVLASLAYHDYEGVAFRDEDLHSYVVTSDGRAYTAVSKVNESVGYDLQTLNAIGAVVGWMFARPSSEALNGYQLTGPILLHVNDLY